MKGFGSMEIRAVIIETSYLGARSDEYLSRRLGAVENALLG
jgi:hypothetical protein